MADPLQTLLSNAPATAPRSLDRFTVEVDYLADEGWIDELHVFVDEPMLDPLVTLLGAGFFPSHEPGPRQASHRTSRRGRTGSYAVEAGGASHHAVTALLRHIVHSCHVPTETYERGRREMEEFGEAAAMGPQRVWSELIGAIRIVSLEGSGSVPVADWGRYDVPTGVPGWLERAILSAPVPEGARLAQQVEFALLGLHPNAFKPLERVNESEPSDEPEIWVAGSQLRAESWSAEALGFAELVGVVTRTMPGTVPIKVTREN